MNGNSPRLRQLHQLASVQTCTPTNHQVWLDYSISMVSNQGYPIVLTITLEQVGFLLLLILPIPCHRLTLAY